MKLAQESRSARAPFMADPFNEANAASLITTLYEMMADRWKDLEEGALLKHARP